MPCGASHKHSSCSPATFNALVPRSQTLQLCSGPQRPSLQSCTAKGGGIVHHGSSALSHCPAGSPAPWEAPSSSSKNFMSNSALINDPGCHLLHDCGRCAPREPTISNRLPTNIAIVELRVYQCCADPLQPGVIAGQVHRKGRCGTRLLVAEGQAIPQRGDLTQIVTNMRSQHLLVEAHTGSIGQKC